MTPSTTLRPRLYLLLASLLAGLAMAHAAPVDADAGTARATDASDSPEPRGELRFIVLGIDAEQGGIIRCALYRNAATWLDRSRRFKRSSARVRGRQAACVFRNVPAGTYAIAALHDADRDAEMDRSLIGIPQEGYAISRNEHDRMSQPDFDEAAIRFDGTRMATRARMKY